MKQSKHTPTPWHRNAYNICSIIKINNGPDSNGHHYVDGRHQVKIASAESATDAAHIVKCVNLHDELVTALEKIALDLDGKIQAADIEDLSFALNTAKDAIAKARVEA